MTDILTTDKTVRDTVISDRAKWDTMVFSGGRRGLKKYGRLDISVIREAVYAFVMFAIIGFAMVRPAISYAVTVKYSVLPGDSLKRIAKRYHIDIASIMKANKLKSSNIRVGQKLKLPKVAAVNAKRLEKFVHKIKKGDRLSKLLKANKMDKRLFAKLNPRLVGRVDRLRVGQKVVLVKEVRLASARHRSRRHHKAGPVKNLEQIEDSRGVLIRRPEHSWATARTAYWIKRLGRMFRKKYPSAAPLALRDVSKEGGGHFGPHASHHEGNDVDMELPKRDDGKVDYGKMFYVIQYLVKTGKVEYIFIDWSHQKKLASYIKKRFKKSWERIADAIQLTYGRGVRRGIVRHAPGHGAHMHIRFVKG